MNIKLKILLGASLFAATFLNAMEEKNIRTEVNTMQIDLSKIALGNGTLNENYKSMEKSVSPIFDFKLMGKLILGKKYWRLATNKQKERYLEEFEKSIKSFYLAKFGLYQGQTLVLKEPIKKKNRIYLTNLIIEKNSTSEIIYKLYKSKTNGWLIYDVDIVGVSVIKVFRAQYKNILKKTNSIDELIEQLK